MSTRTWFACVLLRHSGIICASFLAAGRVCVFVIHQASAFQSRNLLTEVLSTSPSRASQPGDAADRYRVGGFPPLDHGWLSVGVWAGKWEGAGSGGILSYLFCRSSYPIHLCKDTARGHVHIISSKTVITSSEQYATHDPQGLSC